MPADTLKVGCELDGKCLPIQPSKRLFLFAPASIVVGSESNFTFKIKVVS